MDNQFNLSYLAFDSFEYLFFSTNLIAHQVPVTPFFFLIKAPVNVNRTNNPLLELQRHILPTCLSSFKFLCLINQSMSCCGSCSWQLTRTQLELPQAQLWVTLYVQHQQWWEGACWHPKYHKRQLLPLAAFCFWGFPYHHTFTLHCDTKCADNFYDRHLLQTNPDICFAIFLFSSVSQIKLIYMSQVLNL